MTSSPPSVALLGATGFISKPLLTTFTTAAAAATEVKDVVFDDKASLVAALGGVDSLVSAMSMAGDVSTVKKTIVDAAVVAGVRVYGLSPPPSLFSRVDADGDIVHQHPMFAAKQHHFEYAEALVLKVVAVFASLIMRLRFVFGSMCNRHLVPRWRWNAAIGSDEPAGLGPRGLTHRSATPTQNNVHATSALRRKIRRRLSTQQMRFVFTPKEVAWREYEEKRKDIPDLGPLLGPLMAEDCFDHKENQNETINPGETAFAWRRIEGYAKEAVGSWDEDVYKKPGSTSGWWNRGECGGWGKG
ncbi:hypothetical protein FN846DRAFT_887187 [Sphaerosporella brunnea]|uniref:Uncharacterized protein n=1 Tax=Sphaerosporella brunnea TaxID=1250544 RepID=A0A5J5F660_9PEZI|nr:hypothetical protein FN846DRAFT_887187 [Sphaerosporella brunnea]